MTLDRLRPGVHDGVPMDVYHQLPGIGSTMLDWLATSPLHFRHMCSVPQIPTKAMLLGTAVHRAVLEPDQFARTYSDEPDIAGIDSARPRATNEYRNRCAELWNQGKAILQDGAFGQVEAMARAVRSHPMAMRALERAPRREVTVVWDRGSLRCRARIDALGDGSMFADLKTTRSLRGFSPWELTRFSYHRQMAWYREGLRALDLGTFAHVMLIAVESSPPHDVGVFALDPDALAVGEMDCDRLVAQLEECQASDHWPGMFPDVQKATITDSLMIESQMEGVENGSAG